MTSSPTSHLPPRPTEYDSETMARMYLEQGLPERAAELYRMLLALHPDDEALAGKLAEAERLAEPARKQRELREKRPKHPPATGEPMGMLDLEELPEAYGIDEVEILFKDPHAVFVYWEVTEAGMNGARGHLGDEAKDARLVLRIFTQGSAAEQGRTRDVALDGWRGRRYLPSHKPGAQLRAAVGLVAPSGLFAPIAHSSTLRVPPAEPAPYEPNAVEWMEVKPLPVGTVETTPPEIVRKLATGEAPGTRPLSYLVDETQRQRELGAAPSSPGGPTSSPGGAPSSPTGSRSGGGR